MTNSHHPDTWDLQRKGVKSSNTKELESKQYPASELYFHHLLSVALRKLLNLSRPWFPIN